MADKTILCFKTPQLLRQTNFSISKTGLGGCGGLRTGEAAEPTHSPSFTHSFAHSRVGEENRKYKWEKNLQVETKPAQ